MKLFSEDNMSVTETRNFGFLYWAAVISGIALLGLYIYSGNTERYVIGGNMGFFESIWSYLKYVAPGYTGWQMINAKVFGVLPNILTFIHILSYVGIIIIWQVKKHNPTISYEANSYITTIAVIWLIGSTLIAVIVVGFFIYAIFFKRSDN